MSDIGFWELVVCAVVALLVVGPERFPGMIRKIGYYVGQFRRMASAVKSEFDREVDKAEQLQHLLDEQKEIVERHANVDLTQPAVKPPSQSSSTVQAPQVNTIKSDTASDNSTTPPVR